ncbi:MAG TPA: hypothetical protein PLB32_12180, partial [Acidobacteriota bacterium]|nr:hypothetical protein [Acidobacteriota bacterium]
MKNEWDGEAAFDNRVGFTLEKCNSPKNARREFSGWIQGVKRHTITGMIEAAGVVGEVHHERFHRWFS